MSPGRHLWIKCIVAVLVAPVLFATMGASGPTLLAQPCPPGTGYPLPTPIVADPIRAQIHHIGIYDFDTTYLSVTSTSAHTLLIEETAHVPAFFEAIHQIKGIQRYTIRERIVPYSFQTIDTLQYRIAADGDLLDREGVHLSEWGVDRTTDLIEVRLLDHQCPDEITTIRPEIVRHAQHVFDTRYGNGLVHVWGVSIPATHAD